MSTTAIEWTHPPGYRGETLNPVVGCSKYTEGCDNCYAEVMHNRQHAMFKASMGQRSGKYSAPFGVVKTFPRVLVEVSKRNKPTCFFVNSMSDLFHKDVPDAFLHDTFNMMQANPQHRFIVLTKRSRRMARFLSKYCGAYYLPSHIAVGVSVENQEQAEKRLKDLSNVPAFRIVSAEPLLGRVDLSPWLKFVQWVIVGGESGPKARPMHPDWVMQIKRQCCDNDTAFFFKQWGTWAPASAIEGGKLDLMKRRSFAFEDETTMFRVGKGHSVPNIGGQAYPDVWLEGGGV